MNIPLLTADFFILSGDNNSIILFIIGGVLIGIGVLLLFLRKKSLDTVTEIKYVQTSPCKNIIENYQSISNELGKGNYSEYVEIKGAGKSSNPVKSQHTKTDCLWYRSQVVREYEEEVMTTDSNGNRRRETRRGSETVSNVTNYAQFEVDDGTGSIKINPEGAEIHAKQVHNKFEPGEYRGSFQIVLSSLTGGRRTIGYRYTEEIIPINHPLYILGEASDKDGELTVKKSTDKKKKFIVSTKSEEELIRSYSRSALFMLIGSIILPLIGIGLIIYGIFGGKK